MNQQTYTIRSKSCPHIEEKIEENNKDTHQPKSSPHNEDKSWKNLKKKKYPPAQPPPTKIRPTHCLAVSGLLLSMSRSLAYGGRGKRMVDVLAVSRFSQLLCSQKIVCRLNLTLWMLMVNGVVRSGLKTHKMTQKITPLHNPERWR